MQKITITLSRAQRELLDAQVAAGGHRSASAYIALLLDEAEVRRERKRISGLLLEAINGPPATPLTKEDFDDIRREVRRRLAEERKRTQRLNGRKKKPA